MKTIAALALLAVVAPAVHAQSRTGQPGSLGVYRQNRKPTVASVAQLDRAKKLAEQARARTGSGSRRSAWAYGSGR